MQSADLEAVKSCSKTALYVCTLLSSPEDQIGSKSAGYRLLNIELRLPSFLQSY